MSRILTLVAMIAMAFVALAPTQMAFAGDNPAKTEFVPPENPVTDLYEHLITGMSSDELTELAAKYCTKRDPHPMMRTCDDGIRYYWEYTWRKDGCTVFLQVVVMNEKVQPGTMYMVRDDSKKSASSTGDTNQKVGDLQLEIERLKQLVPPDPPHTVLEAAHDKLKKGMSWAAAQQMMGNLWHPAVYPSKCHDGQSDYLYVVYDMGYYIGRAPDGSKGDEWEMKLCISFVDDKLYSATYHCLYETRRDELPSDGEKK